MPLHLCTCLCSRPLLYVRVYARISSSIHVLRYMMNSYVYAEVCVCACARACAWVGVFMSGNIKYKLSKLRRPLEFQKSAYTRLSKSFSHLNDENYPNAVAVKQSEYSSDQTFPQNIALTFGSTACVPAAGRSCNEMRLEVNFYCL